jgi:hypothetical protein
MDIKPGMVFITQGDTKSIVSWVIRLATGSWWTHGFVALTETEAIEATFPRVQHLNIAERLAELKKDGRDVVIMDLPGITDEQRTKVAAAAESFNHRLYDIWNCLYFVLFNVWWEGGKRLVCSRLMAASFLDGIGVRIFDHAEKKLPESLQHTLQNLEDGYCTPDEVLRYSDLEIIERIK